MSQKSKVKSYARRTKSGIARVTGHSRKSDKSKRNRNIAIGVGVGTSILALGLGAKHLAKKKGLKGKIGNTTPPQAQAQAVSFTPKNPSPSPSSSPKPKPKVETPSATVSDIKQTTQAVVNKAKEIKIEDKPSSNPSQATNLREATRAARQQANVTIVDESKTRLASKLDNSMKVAERRNLLMQVSPEKDALMRPYFGADAKLNSNRQLRKKNAKRLAEAARDLRSRGMYPDNPKPKSKN